MKTDAVRWLPALSLLVVIGCDANDSSTDGSGGNVSTGGTPAATGGSPAGTGGTATGGVATGGTATGGTAAGGSTGGSAVTAMPFPFPQNKKPPNCTLTTVANASGAVQSAYTSWKNAFVTTATPGLRVRRPNNGDDTVSEGIAYGMLAAVYMADRTTFDGLWTYAKGHSNKNKLMSWHINSSGGALDAGSAADADEDMAWALIGAASQWGSETYLNDAKMVINAMFSTSIGSDGALRPGDGWGATADTFPDYFSPAYFRVFAKISGNPAWSGAIIDRNYEILKNSTGMYGLVPDKTTGTYMPTGDTKDYKYDACRTPWRIAMDYCFNGEPRALEYLQKIGPFFANIGATNIVDGYTTTGTPIGNAHNMAFIGPAGVAGMAGYQKLLDDAFTFGTSGGGDQSYYPQSLRVISMLMMSGNFIDISKL